MLDDGFEEEVVLIGQEAGQPGTACAFRGSASDFSISMEEITGCSMVSPISKIPIINPPQPSIILHPENRFMINHIQIYQTIWRQKCWFHWPPKPLAFPPSTPEARRDKQVLFFSATWPPSVERAALRLCSRPAAVLQRVRLEPQEVESKEGRSLPPDVIEQVVEVVKRDDHETRQQLRGRERERER